jgi:hypothetical protein
VSCSICAEIPETVRANTGRDHALPETTTKLKALNWGGRDQDLWECPQCRNLYTYSSDQAFSGSGNTDEDVLTRLTTEEARVIRAFAVAGTAPPDSLAGQVDAFFALPGIAHTVALNRAYTQNREVARRLIPRIVAELARTSSFQYRDLLVGFGKARKDDAKRIVDEIAKQSFDKGHPLEWVKQQCEQPR